MNGRDTCGPLEDGRETGLQRYLLFFAMNESAVVVIASNEASIV